jgi:hypothetical protein
MSKDPRKVFVVHGRNEQLRGAVFAFLRALGLQPMEWSQLLHSTGTATPFVGEVLDTGFSSAQAVVVVLNGDDMAYLRESFWGRSEPDYERQPSPQPRPNVLFEAGMAFGRYPSQTILVQVGNIRPFTDIAGRHVVRLSNSADDRNAFAQRLRTCGCEVDTSGRDWLSTGDFGAVEPDSSADASLQAVQPKNPPKSEVHPDYIRILIMIGEGSGVNRYDIGKKSNLSIVRSDYFIDKLFQDKLVYSHSGSSNVYITEKGRAFLFEGGHI